MERIGPTRSQGEPRHSFLLGLAPSGVYLAERVAPPTGALLPHRFTLTSCRDESRPIGGILSVALSRSLQTVGVTHHRALWSPDFPPRNDFARRNAQFHSAAATRPTSQSAILPRPMGVSDPLFRLDDFWTSLPVTDPPNPA